MSTEASDWAHVANANGDVSIQAWCDEHRLLPHLLPFEYRKTTPIEFLEAVVDGLDDIPKTAATFRPTKIDGVEHAPAAGANIMTDMLGTLGSWRVEETTPTRWTNPQYVHLDSLQTMPEKGDRMEIIERCAAYGTLTVGDVAPRLGITKGSLRRWLTRKNVPWSHLRHEGIVRLARTLRTASEWGYSERRHARVLPRAEGTVRSWIQNHARDTDFEPPADPSGEQWFMGGQIR
ncbi:hypothetical protein C5B90_19275 [Haloferax sp. Atlit-12N]|uniref:hypothetical protein n=1 Tax=Haloferax sp. Atlit-12N TaxID=2077203 RepID=UPI000E27CC2E|nr:hypothetical protein [Haloferax sp. Atlit-12N]RDZ61414.1 hypothetical protein C5B90_19275 [Haloferax sp. Atlit-12N]